MAELIKKEEKEVEWSIEKDSEQKDKEKGEKKE